MRHSPSLASQDILAPWLRRLPARAIDLLARSPAITQAARDVAMFVDGFTPAARPASRLHRPGEARVESARALPGERAVRVLGVRRETARAVSLVLERPAGLSFLAGQFVTLVVPALGGELRRSYSISSTPDDDTLVITIKRVERGQGSGWLHDSVAAGSVLRMRGPSGAFTFSPDALPGHLLLVGGGSGITPLLSIARTALTRAPGLPVTLVYANTRDDEIIFAAELARLEAVHPELRVLHVLEAPSGERACRPGRVSREALSEALGGVFLDHVTAYVCGPPPMMERVVPELHALGLDPARVHVERFASLRPVRAAAAGLYTLRVGGVAVRAPSGRTLLESATEAGVDLPFSCTMGGCGTCKAQLVAGEILADEPNCLSADERARGLVLPCVSRPLSDLTLKPFCPPPDGARP